MTQSPDDPNDPRDRGSGERGSGDPWAGRRIDEDAAWREIVANYGEPALDPPSETEADPEAGTEPGLAPESGHDPEPEPPASRDERLRGLFQPSWNDPLQTGATWEDEGHFVPPDPPPVRVQDPRRRAAWAGLFGSPALMLVAVVLGWGLPDWVLVGLTGAFVGGFVYLVATMRNKKHGDGGDGAVV